MPQERDDPHGYHERIPANHLSRIDFIADADRTGLSYPQLRQPTRAGWIDLPGRARPDIRLARSKWQRENDSFSHSFHAYGAYIGACQNPGLRRRNRAEP